MKLSSIQRFTPIRIALVFAILLGILGVSMGKPLAANAQSFSPAHPFSSADPIVAFSFIVTATTSNTNTYLMTIDNSEINDSPNYLLQVMQIWPGNYDTHPTGVWYNPSLGRWTIFNEDLAPLPAGTSFAVKAEWNTTYDGVRAAFPLTASASGSFVVVDNSIINSNPGAAIFVTQNWLGTYDPHYVGVEYVARLQRWAIFNQDNTDIPAGSSFAIEVTNTVGASNVVSVAHIQQATTSNTNNYITYLDFPSVNGVSWAIPRVTAVYNSQGQCGCVIDNHPLGTWYNSARQQWTIYNTDQSPIPGGATFFISIY